MKGRVFDCSKRKNWPTCQWSIRIHTKKKVVMCMQSHDTPRPSIPNDTEWRGSLQKISLLSAFSPTVLEEQLLALTNPSEMRDTRCKVHLALRLAECCNAEEFTSDHPDSRSVSESWDSGKGSRAQSIVESQSRRARSCQFHSDAIQSICSDRHRTAFQPRLFVSTRRRARSTGVRKLVLHRAGPTDE